MEIRYHVDKEEIISLEWKGSDYLISPWSLIPIQSYGYGVFVRWEEDDEEEGERSKGGVRIGKGMGRFHFPKS